MTSPIDNGLARPRPHPTSQEIQAIAQVLEERHLVAWSKTQTERVRFGAELGLLLSQHLDVQICTIHGLQVRDLYGFCSQLERALATGRIRRSLDGRDGVIDALRRRPARAYGRAIKHRFYLWHDAHVMLEADPVLFGRLVDAITGVAAESEYVDEDLLLIQRAVFLGGPALEVYSQVPGGQFQVWYREGEEDPLWQIATGLDAPPIETHAI